MGKFSIVSRVASKAIFKVKRYSPEILLGAGIVAGVAGTVLACKSTLKASYILDDHRKKMDEIKEAAETCPEVYSDADRKKDTAVVYVDTFKRFIKLYWKPIVLEVAAIGCVLTSYGIMRHRNLVLTLACSEALSDFNKYRDRVKAKYGEEADRELLADSSKAVVETDEKGEVKSVDTKDILCSPYAKFFDSSCPNWENSPEYNYTFLVGIQNRFNERLRAKGHVFLNEVYDALGLPRTAAGAVVGWIYNGEGDNRIDFDLDNANSEATRRFVNGLENVYLLDFNVDGVIYDKI